GAAPAQAARRRHRHPRLHPAGRGPRRAADAAGDRRAVMTEQGAAGARDARSRVILTVEEPRALLATHGLLGGAGGSAPASSPLAPIVLDVRWTLPKPDGRDDFEAGHIPGARYVALDTELADHANADPTRGRHPLPTVDQFEQTVREWRV